MGLACGAVLGLNEAQTLHVGFSLAGLCIRAVLGLKMVYNVSARLLRKKSFLQPSIYKIRNLTSIIKTVCFSPFSGFQLFNMHEVMIRLWPVATGRSSELRLGAVLLIVIYSTSIVPILLALASQAAMCLVMLIPCVFCSSFTLYQHCGGPMRGVDLVLVFEGVGFVLRNFNI